jgi:mRNA interferase HigB
MQIIAKSTLRAFWERHPQARIPLSVWHAVVSKVEWHRQADIKLMFGSNVDFVGDNRVIFDIAGTNTDWSSTSLIRSNAC